MLKFKEYREKAGLTGAEAARRMGISRQALHNYEAGIRKADFETLLKMSETYGVSVAVLTGHETDNAPNGGIRGELLAQIIKLNEAQACLLRLLLEVVVNDTYAEIVRGMLQALTQEDHLSESGLKIPKSAVRVLDRRPQAEAAESQKPQESE